MILGSDAHLPRQIRSPARRIETAVSFHRHVETDIFFHGCSPFDAWARRPVVSPYFHPIGEQPPSKTSDWLGQLAPAITPCGRLLHRHESAKDMGAV